jgi:hypothetical protein
MKWNPGHYMQLFLNQSTPAWQQKRFGYYDEIASNANIEGVVLFVRWRELETALGSYAAGIGYLERELEKLKSLAAPKRLYVRMAPQYYGTSGAQCDSYFPDYILDLGGCAASSSGSIAAFWNPTITNRYIALLQALAAAFDSEPYFEGIWPIRETATGRNPERGFDWSAFDTQLRRIALAARTAFTRTNVVMSVNYLESQARTDRFVEYLYKIGVGVGGPDTAPTVGIWSYKTLQGHSGGVDYRGRIPIHWSVEASELGYDGVGPPGGYTATEIMDFADRTLRTSHLFWARNDTVGTPAQRWHTGILAVINSRPLTHTRCPAVYRACN